MDMKTEMEKAFDENQNIILKFAYDMSAPGQYLFDEIIEAGYIAFMRAWDLYQKDRSRTKFSTYFYLTMKNEIVSILEWLEVRKGNDVFNPDDIKDQSPRMIDTERRVLFRRMLESLSEDAKFVINLIFRDGLFNLMSIRAELRRLWHGEELQNRLSDSFKEIKFALKTF